MKVPGFPYRVQIELCNFCNARCITCPISAMKRKRGIMDFELFREIIDELGERNFDGFIYPFLNGEALLVSNFIDYLELIKNRVPKATINLYTNASKLDDRIGGEILRNNLLDILTVSFDGGTRETFESIRVGLSFEEVRQNVHSFVHNRNKMGKKKPKVMLRMVVTPENKHTKQVLKEEFKDADEMNFSFMYNWAGQLRKEGGVRNILTKCNFCPRMYEYFTILVSGDVCLCCFDYEGGEIVGGLRENSIEEIWLGDKFQTKRKQLAKREFDKLPLCKDCDFINHNLIGQQMFKIRPFIGRKFPTLAKLATALYKSLIGLGHNL